ncbi:MAG: hypothetical protein JWO69_1048 [Thermoleophilia bacterium]|jgi:hypothetical protein|nr:hypothetical protein [Thermoleophilia bacterium]
MAPNRNPTERASTLVEQVGLAAGAALLLGMVAVQFRGDGGRIGGTVGARVTSAVAGDSVGEAPRAGHPLAKGSRRGVEEFRRGGGSLPARVSRDDIRLSPTLPGGAAVASGTATRRGSIAGVAWSVDATACALCVGVGFEHAVRAGASTGRDKATATGLELEGAAGAHAALVGVGARGSASRTVGPATIDARVRAQALVGGDVEGEAKVRLGKSRQELELRGGAMAGAIARGSGSVGVELFGVALEQSASAEGWAGAGARGALGVAHSDDRITWNVGWGAAVGFGGALDWSGSVDVSQVSQAHRAAARRSLRTAISSTIPLSVVSTLARITR